MDIKEAIIHGIGKESGSKVVDLLPRTELSVVDKRMRRLGEQVLGKYGKSPSNYGTLDSDHKRYQFPKYLNEYYTNDLSLVEFSTEALTLLASKIESAASATGGYALFLRYTSQGQDWLLIVMLKLKTGTGIDKTTLELSDSLSFDIDHLHEAARIDLKKCAKNDQPYLSFIKNSKRTDDVTIYFRQALGCTVFTESRFNTEQLLDSIDLYCDDKKLDREETLEVRRKTFEYCEAKKKLGEAVVLTSLSAIVNDQEPTEFLEFVRGSEFEVSETFDPHPTTYARYKRIRGKFGSVSVSFDIADLQDETVDYDEDNEYLIINNLPPKLVEQILKAKAKN